MSCIVCGGISATIVWRENGFEGRACACGTVYTSPTPPPGIVDISYDAHPSDFYATYAALKARWVKRHCPLGRLLEVGCGDGFFLEAARQLGYDISGIDASPVRAARVSERLGIPIQCAYLEALDWPDAQFDVIYHCDMLAHFPDPVFALKKMVSMLAPGGVLAFEAGTLGGISPAWYPGVGCLGYPEHRWLYSKKSLFQLLEKADLQVQHVQHFGLAPAVALNRVRSLVGTLVGGFGKQGKGMNTTRAVTAGMRRADKRTSQRVGQFMRYRVGALAPDIGPATYLISAMPKQEAA